MSAASGAVSVNSFGLTASIGVFLPGMQLSREESMAEHKIRDFTQEATASIFGAASIARCALLLLYFASLPTLAEPIELTCRTTTGYDIPVTIDLEKMEGTWGMGVFPYKVTHINDDLVTMIERNDSNPGGEFLVLNRATGEYQRASVYKGCDQDGKNCRLTSFTQEAQCSRKVF
jgi:hypothetical protein